jgi:hypothetical protein
VKPTEAGAYRQGLVLGFTMAEIMILILFVMLLTLVMLIRIEKADTDRVRRDNIELSNQLFTANKELEVTRTLVSGDKSISDLARELVIAETEVVRLTDESQRFSERDKIASEVEEMLRQAAIEPTPNALREIISSAGEYEKYLQSDPTSAELVHQLEVLDSEVERMSGQLANAQRQLISAGKGTEFPSCWARKDGTVEYIFNIALQSRGFVVRQTDLPERIDERTRLPIGQLHYDTLLSQEEMLASTDELFQWSRGHNCRFFVRVFDQTGESEKAIYQSRLRTVEHHFYKFISTSEFH